VVKKLAELKGRAWVERLIAQYKRDFSGFKPGSRIRRAVDELSEELTFPSADELEWQVE
jgi:hypothetical protein